MLSFRSLVSPTALILGLAAQPVAAQERRDEPIPKSAMPPAGMCRVWLDNVAAAQQPAPTDCSTAVKNSPGSGARLIFGTFSKAARIRTLEPVQPGITNRQSSEQLERAYGKRFEQAPSRAERTERTEQVAPRGDQATQRAETNDRRQMQVQAAAANARAAVVPPPTVVRPQPVARPTPAPVKPPEKPQY